MVKPVLKWAGGKRQLLEEIYGRFPADFDRYHEPFLGGGAVFFDLEPDDATVNDTNPRLANFYRVVRDRPDELIARLREFDDPEADPDPDRAFAEENWKGNAVEQYFYQQRARFNRRAYADEEWPATGADRVEEAALLLYLNRTCYNGLYRENSGGGFNVPIGRYADPEWVMADRVRAASRALADTDVRNADFAYVLDAADEGDLVYLDPPYEPMSATANFAEYSAEGFGREDQERLLETVEELDEKGVYFVLSNSGVMYEPYDDAGFRVEKEGATRSINSDETARGEVDEIVATNVSEADRAERGQASFADF
ncbi:Dam family site-specific DNA-(adenine-N6)-methyltransferase [Halorubrum sp. CBA1125]|uniref:DNA adenine methylase n=1 Tax=Halorubrum sp. CBA1125 TaxID=2668072 RepID=UPI0012E89F50|nr:DNA adenine methylase [Halorubrum sp. CBA1125]MUW15491.1 Dam family site-specific DNA-(adenine-N6)-methyltransferase [Halorubrum sp. CBA1125]